MHIYVTKGYPIVVLLVAGRSFAAQGVVGLLVLPPPPVQFSHLYRGTSPMRNRPPLLGTPQDPRHRPTVGS